MPAGRRHAGGCGQLAGQGLDGDHHVRGKGRGPPSPWQVAQPGQALVEEPLAPLGDHLAGSVQPGGDLVVAQAVGGVQHDPGPHDVPVR